MHILSSLNFENKMRVFHTPEIEGRDNTRYLRFCCFCCLLAPFTIWAIWTGINDYTANVPTISQYQSLSKHPSVVLTPKNSSFGILVTINNSEAMQLNSSYFSISMLNGETALPIDYCNSEQFERIGSFNQEQWNSIICPNYETLVIQGLNGQGEYQSFRMYLQQCENGTLPNLVCASPSQIENIFTNSEIRVYVFYQNYFVDGNLENPCVQQSEYYGGPITISNWKTMQFSLQQTLIITRNEPFTSAISNQEESFFILNPTSSSVNYVPATKKFLTVFFRFVAETLTIDREYLNLKTAVAELLALVTGFIGIAGFLIAICGLIRGGKLFTCLECCCPCCCGGIKTIMYYGCYPFNKICADPEAVLIVDNYKTLELVNEDKNEINDRVLMGNEMSASR